MTRYRTVLLLACAPLLGQQYRISTIAGNGVAGVSLDNPMSVAVDSAGDVYVGDWSGFIRKIWVKERAVTIVAGTGILGYSGDGELATNAMLGRASRFALDAAGNIYIADADSHRIRKIDISTGIISRIAGTGEAADRGDGGPALNAGVAQPTGITVDTEGNVYFSSSWSRVRKLTVNTGMIETVAGQQVTSFGGDNGLAVDALFWDPIPSAVNRGGDIYITDYENSRIRVVSASTKRLTTVAGSSACVAAPPPFGVLVCKGAFDGDGGPARNATLNYASAAALDDDGNLYIADTLNHRIRRVDVATGIIDTLAGTGEKGFGGDGGPALAAEISYPSAIAVGHTGKVYFADQGNHRIRVLIPAARPSPPFGQRPSR